MRKDRDPKTKEDFLDRLLMADFDGDIRNLGAQPARIKRLAANALELVFPDSGVVYELTVHRPRDAKQEARSFKASNEDFTIPPEPKPAPAPARRKRGQGAQASQ